MPPPTVSNLQFQTSRFKPPVSADSIYPHTVVRGVGTQSLLSRTGFKGLLSQLSPHARDCEDGSGPTFYFSSMAAGSTSTLTATSDVAGDSDSGWLAGGALRPEALS